MDDIARDVVQRQAHNEYVVATPGPETTTPRFPWHELDGGVQEMILQDAPVHSRRYFTNPGGGFNWTELERGVRAQILRHVDDRSGRLDLHLRGREPWPASYDSRGHSCFSHDVHTIQNLRFVTQGVLQAWPAALLNVTFSTRLDRWWPDEDEWWPDEDDEAREIWAPTAAMEDALYAQVQRTYSWTGVRAIRLIRHDGIERDDYDQDSFTFQIVRSGEHGDEVIEAPESFRLSRAQRDELATLLTTSLGMQHRVMRELGIEHRLRQWWGRAPGRRARWAEIEIAREEERYYAVFDEQENAMFDAMDDAMDNVEGHARRTRNRAACERDRERNRRALQHFDEDWVEHPNGEEWSVRTVPAAAGARVLAARVPAAAGAAAGAAT